MEKLQKYRFLPLNKISLLLKKCPCISVEMVKVITIVKTKSTRVEVNTIVNVNPLDNRMASHLVQIYN